ncbi:Chromosome (plasmid) partitioning protein ParA [hydrothermal vent metagenome]|uniref:Chromosome (Plasmid) partitioning protein ParA n=1 Tax=hydrothermal vent metagenome TaxID=652676 RepID=A0A3B0WRX8_9ZZZZ
MGRKIAVINQKGGVGKTTTTANLGYMLAQQGYTVTLIDLDPQGSLTVSMGVDWQEHLGIEDLLLHDEELKNVIVNSRKNLRLIPSGNHLGQVEHFEGVSSSLAKSLRTVLNQLGDDYVLIDCPPSSGFLIICALYSIDEVLIPISGDYLTLHGLSHLLGTLKSFEARLKHNIKKWFVVTRFHPGRRLSQEVKNKLVSYFPGQVLKTSIRETTALAESPGFGLTIEEYKKKCNGTDDYRNLANDFCIGRTC